MNAFIYGQLRTLPVYGIEGDPNDILYSNILEIRGSPQVNSAGIVTGHA